MKSTTTVQPDVIKEVGGRRQLQYLKLYKGNYIFRTVMKFVSFCFWDTRSKLVIELRSRLLLAS